MINPFYLKIKFTKMILFRQMEETGSKGKSRKSNATFMLRGFLPAGKNNERTISNRKTA